MNFKKEMFLGRKITLYQPEKGYRFSLDSPLISWFVETDSSSTILDVGAGTGIISFIIAKCKKFKYIVSLEIQRELIFFLKKGITENGFSGKVLPVCGDFKKIHFKKRFDVIVSNPPYRDPKKGKISPNLIKAVSTFEIKLNFKELLSGVYTFLKEEGSFFVVIPHDRYKEFLKKSEHSGFNLGKKISVFHTKNSNSPVFFLLKLVKYRTFLEKDAIYLKKENSDEYTEEVDAILRGEGCL